MSADPLAHGRLLETELLERANAALAFPVLDELRADEVATGVKYVSAGESYFAGHFPQEPILPGVVILGALVGVASALRDGVGEAPAVKRIRRFRFVRPVRPGDRLELRVRPIQDPKGEDGWFEGTATVDGQLVARGRFLL